MRASRGLGFLAGTTALALATLVVASPASAATLPDGQKITIVEFLDTNSPAEGQFYNVNPADAASTPVGTGTGETISGLEVNDEGIGAAIGQLDSVSTVWTADANTGTISNPQTITVDGQIQPDSCDGIDLVNGTFIVACDEGGDADTSYVGALDPATGALISFITVDGDDYVAFDAIANSTVTAQLWGFAHIGAVSHSFTIDLENNDVDEVAPMENDVWAADFDRNGQLFVSSEELFGNEIEIPALAVTDPAVGTFSFIEPYVSTTTDTALIFVAALSIWGVPALAATGAASVDAFPIGLGSALLLLAGAAFVATARIGRRKAA